MSSATHTSETIADGAAESTGSFIDACGPEPFTIDTQHAICMVCGEPEYTVSFSRRHLWLKRCVRCGFQFADPQPSESELAEIYDADYYQAFGWCDGVRDTYRRMMCCRAERLLQYAEAMFPPSRLLDVGSGLGNLLWVGQQREWKVCGVERNCYAVACADEYVPGATVCCQIEEYGADEEKFGLVTLLDVIEHLRRPDQVLCKLHTLLQPGGGIVISTVDAGCLAARLMGSRWPLYIREHLWYFTRSNLTAIVERAGFTVLECNRARKAFTLHYLLSILSHPQQSPLIRRSAAVALRMMPGWIARRIFSLREGLFLMARRNDD